MTVARRSWLSVIDGTIVEALDEAARDCMAQVCAHRPDDCRCAENLMLPPDFVEWLKDELKAAARDPLYDQSAGRPGRRIAAERREQLNLALT